MRLLHHRPRDLLIASPALLRPTMPDIPGIELGINSDGFFELESLPKKCAVVGSGGFWDV